MSERERKKQQLMNETEDKMKLVTASAESTTCFQYFGSVRFCFVSVAADAAAAFFSLFLWIWFLFLRQSQSGRCIGMRKQRFWPCMQITCEFAKISPVSGLHEQFHPVHWAAANIDIFTRTLRWCICFYFQIHWICTCHFFFSRRSCTANIFPFLQFCKDKMSSQNEMHLNIVANKFLEIRTDNANCKSFQEAWFHHSHTHTHIKPTDWCDQWTIHFEKNLGLFVLLKLMSTVAVWFSFFFFFGFFFFHLKLFENYFA